jgi:hypothetical protein
VALRHSTTTCQVTWQRFSHERRPQRLRYRSLTGLRRQHKRFAYPMKKTRAIIPRETVEGRIYLLRGEKAMLSTDLAHLYRVAPRALVQAVKRNLDRFPDDFMFQLSSDEFRDLKSQIVTSSWGGLRRATPSQGIYQLRRGAPWLFGVSEWPSDTPRPPAKALPS